MTNEVEEILKWIQENEAKPVSVAKKFMTSTVNALWSITTAQKLNHEDPKVAIMLERYTSKFFNVSSSMNLYLHRFVSDNEFADLMITFFPSLARMMPFLVSKLTKVADRVQTFCAEYINQHIEAKPPECDSARDVIDVYLDAIRKCDDPKSTFYKDLGRMNCIIRSDTCYLIFWLF